jgi:hypothetical protein
MFASLLVGILSVVAFIAIAGFNKGRSLFD